MKSREELIQAAESKNNEEIFLDFKSEFDPNSNGAWCEVLKDIAAFANTGGGIILIGVNDNGTSSEANLDALRKTDPATFTDKVFKYTGIQFSGFEILDIDRSGFAAIGILVKYTFPPLVFIKPGTYQDPNNPKKQKTGFGQGVLYFRHGTKSEPANSFDVSRIVEIELDKRRKGWLENIRKVVEAPSEFEVSMIPASLKESKEGTIPIRITDSENAPEYKLAFWEYYKYRRKELVIELSKIIKDRDVGVHDIQSVVKVYKITDKPKFATIPEGQGPRYSDEFIKWLVEQHRRNRDFFDEAREKYRELVYRKK